LQVFRRSRVSAGTPVSALGGRGNRAREEDERPRESTDRSRPPQNRRLAKARSGLSAISASRSAEDADVRKPGTTRSAAQLGRRGDPGGGSGSGGCAIPSRNAGEHRGGGSGRVEAGRRSSDRPSVGFDRPERQRLSLVECGMRPGAAIAGCGAAGRYPARASRRPPHRRARKWGRRRRRPARTSSRAATAGLTPPSTVCQRCRPSESR
jgi:hypothetical protein